MTTDQPSPWGNRPDFSSVSFPSSTGESRPNSGSMQPFPPGGPKKRSGVGLALWILGGIFGTMLLVCCGGFVALYRMESKHAPQGEHLRLPRGLDLPSDLRTALEDPSRLPTAEDKELLDSLIASGAVEGASVDSVQFAGAIESSKLNPGINWLTRRLIGLALEEGLFPPEFEASSARLVRVDWVELDRQARAIVAVFPPYGSPELYAVWVVKNEKGNWRFYDWKEVGHSETEAELFGLLLLMPDRDQSKFHDYSQRLADCYTEDQSNYNRKADRIEAAYESASIPASIRNAADALTAHYYALYSDWERLLSLSSRMNADVAPIAHLYKARALQELGRKEESMKALRSFHARIGWHPLIGLIGVHVAESDADKRWVAKQLMRNLTLAPDHYVSCNAFRNISNVEDRVSLVQHLEKSGIAADELIPLANSQISDDDAGRAFKNALEGCENFSNLASLLKAEARFRAQEYAVAVPELLALQAKWDSEVVRRRIRQLLAPATRNSEEVFKLMSEGVEDPIGFWEDVREQMLIYQGNGTGLRALRAAVDRPPAGVDQNAIDDFVSQPRTQVVWALEELARRDYDAAWKRLFPITIDSESFEPYDYQGSMNRGLGPIAVRALAEAACRTNRIADFMDKFNALGCPLNALSQELQMPQDIERYEQAVKLYAAYPDHSAAWLKLHRARLLFTQRNWEASDALYAELVAEVPDREGDESLYAELDTNFRTLDLASDYDIQNERVENAKRSCNLERLIAKVDEAISETVKAMNPPVAADSKAELEKSPSESPDIDASFEDKEADSLIPPLCAALEQTEDAELLERFAKVLLRSTNRQESRLAFRMRAAAADFRSDMTAAAAAWLDLAGATDESGYPNREQCLMQAAWRIADGPSSDGSDAQALRLRLRKAITSTPDEATKAWIGPVTSAIIARDSEALKKVMTELDPQSKLRLGYMLSDEVHPEVNALRDAGLLPIRDTYDLDCTHEILLLLNQEPDQAMIKPDRMTALDAWTGEFKSSDSLATERMDDVHWIHAMDFANGRLVVASLKDANTRLISDDFYPSNSSLRNEVRGAVVLQWYGTRPYGKQHQILFELAKKVVSEHSSVLAMSDIGGDAWAADDNWRTRLAESNYACPTWVISDAYTSWYIKPAVERDPKAEDPSEPKFETFTFGLLNERIEVGVQSSDDESNATIELLHGSLIHPQVKRGDRFESYLFNE